MIKGITVKLYQKTESGRDDFNHPIYTETAIDVENVLIGHPSSTEVLDTLNITGRKAVYTLGIPKGDTHDWEDKTVKFFGRKFKTIGIPVEGIEELIPLSWNKQIKVEVYNGS